MYDSSFLDRMYKKTKGKSGKFCLIFMGVCDIVFHVKRTNVVDRKTTERS